MRQDAQGQPATLLVSQIVQGPNMTTRELDHNMSRVKNRVGSVSATIMDLNETVPSNTALSAVSQPIMFSLCN